MSSPIVTVLIPRQKRPEELRIVKKSVLAQAYTSLKIVVLDRATNDETPEVFRHFLNKNCHVVYYADERNIGIDETFQFFGNEDRHAILLLSHG